MGFIFGLINKLLRLFVYFLIFAAVIVLIPNLPPYTSFTKIILEPPQPLTGTLAPNKALDNAEKLYIDKVLGPEAFQLYKGEVYTSVATGEIVKLSPGGHVTFVTKIGQPCTGIKQEHICGRPLGFTFDENKNQMYVADAYHGIWRVDLKTDKKQLLVSPNVEIKGRTPKLFNHVALDSSGNLFWTDSSSDFQLNDGAFSMLTDPSGRLFQYNAAKNTSTVLLDNLWFANGVIVSPDNQFVVVAETFAKRLHKYYINGPKKGKSEIFASGLPGAPDNIRSLPDGSGLLVGLPVAHDGENPDVTRSLAAAPYARKFLARLLRLVELPFEFLNNQYQHFVFEDIVHKIGRFDGVAQLITDPSGLLQMDWDGNVVAYYINKDNTVGFISDGIVFNDRLYLGRPHGQNFVGSVPAPPLLRKAFSGRPLPEVSKTERANEQPKARPTPKPTTAPPPTTTTTTRPPSTTTPPPSTTTPPPSTTTPPPSTTTPPPSTTKRPPTTTQQPPKKSPPPAPTAKATVAPPKPQENKDLPKQTQERPKAQSTTMQQPRSAEPVNPTTKPSPKKDKAATDSTTPKPTTAMPKSGSASPPPKVAKEDAKSKQSQANIPKPDEKVPKQQIPIKEEIPSDTAKPNKETLKVIKKEGPTEIPNPQL